MSPKDHPVPRGKPQEDDLRSGGDFQTTHPVRGRTDSEILQPPVSDKEVLTVHSVEKKMPNSTADAPAREVKGGEDVVEKEQIFGVDEDWSHVEPINKVIPDKTLSERIPNLRKQMRRH